MFVNFLRTNRVASIFLTFLRVYLGFQWMTHGYEKLTSGGFDASGFLKGAIANSSGEHPAVQSWWASFLDSFALPNVELFNVLIPWGEFLVGVALLLGVFTTFAMLMGLTMNFAFLFSGTTSTNPQMVFLGLFILIAGYNAGKYGLDHWVIPFIQTKILKKDLSQS